MYKLSPLSFSYFYPFRIEFPPLICYFYVDVNFLFTVNRIFCLERYPRQKFCCVLFTVNKTEGKEEFMKTIAVYSHKGGTGKTTTVFNIAGILCKDYKKKVLCIDCDPQANLTEIMMARDIEANGGTGYLNSIMTIEDVFLAPDKINNAIHPAQFSLTENGTPKKRGIDIIPARPKTLQLRKDLDNITTGLDTGVIDRGQLKTAFKYIRKTRSHMYDYDYCLIDFPPTANILTEDILSAADYVLVPTTMDKAAKEGVSTMFSAVANVRKSGNPNLEILGIVPIAFDKRLAYDTLSLDALKQSDLLIDTPIRNSTDVRWAAEYGIPLVYNRRSAPITQDYRDLVKAVLQKMGDI